METFSSSEYFNTPPSNAEQMPDAVWPKHHDATALSAIPPVETNPEPATLSHEDIHLVENFECGTFSARFALELAGIVWNGLTRGRADLPRSLCGVKPDGLLNLLVPSLDDSAQLKFELIGGVETVPVWRLHGIISGAETQEMALAAATQLRQTSRAFLASQPHLKFAPKPPIEAQQHEHLAYTFRARLIPHPLWLSLPSEQPIGFANNREEVDPQRTWPRVALAFPAERSFGSLVDTLAICPCVVHLDVTLSPFTLDESTLVILADALDSIRRNPLSFEKQFKKSHLNHELSSTFLTELQNWLRTRKGVRIACEVSSPEPIPEPVMRMIGNQVFGAEADLLSLPQHPEQESPSWPVSVPQAPQADSGDLDLSNCLRADVSWPSFFPEPASFSARRIPRCFNHQRPTSSQEGLLLGHLPEGRTPIRLGESERAQHIYVLGATGTGKSTLLFNMILQDIAAGRGVGLIDPHGDLYDQLLDAMPPSRVKDVILFNPGRSDCSPGINPLEFNSVGGSNQAGFIINELLATFDRLYDMRHCGGPMFETYFRNAMLLLLESGLNDATLTEFPLVFEDAKFRNSLKERCRNPLVVSFWANQAEKVKGDAALENIAPYIISKLNAFLCNSVVRAIIGQAKSTIHFGKAMDNRKILLMKLPKGVLGELDTQLLGSLLLSKLFATALGRANVPSGERTPFHLYVDEFQNFTNDTVAHMLSESRKYGLHLTLANQNLSQLDANHGRQNILNAVLGNVGNLILFRTGPMDAQKVWPYTAPEFGSLDLQALPNFYAVSRLMSSQAPTRPFVFHSLPQVTGGDYKRTSRSEWDRREKSFAKPLAEVEGEIARRREAHCQPSTECKATTAEALGR